MSERVFVEHEEADAFAKALLAAHGVPKKDAATVAACLVRADLRGVDTHGLTRLPVYLERVRRGLVNPRPKLLPKRVAPAAAVLDGQNGFGFVIGTRAMTEAISLARKSGVGIVAARRSTHFGMAASYVLQALDAGFVALVFTNASRAMPPWGGREALLGTSPLAAGAPGGKLAPFVLDMSPAVAARGKIRIAEKRGEKIPLGFALDGEGRPTSDPTEALKGVGAQVARDISTASSTIDKKLAERGLQLTELLVSRSSEAAEQVHKAQTRVTEAVPGLLERLSKEQGRLSQVIEGATQNLAALESVVVQRTTSLDKTMKERTEALQTSLGVDVQGETIGVAEGTVLSGVSAHRLAVATGLAATEVTP